MIDQPRLPLGEVETDCLTCGARVINVPRSSGRYRRFCSMECKRERARMQRAGKDRKARTAALAAPGVCVICGEEFEHPKGRAGRPAHMCSKACRVIAARRRSAIFHKGKAGDGGRVESSGPLDTGPAPVLRIQNRPIKSKKPIDGKEPR